MKLLHLIFSILLLGSAISIFLTSNPVHSVIYLIVCFILSALILILLKIDFIALLYIMVYVGAIAVLFLFVIMMINTKSIKKDRLIFSKYERIFIYIFGFTFFFFLYNFLQDFFFDAFEDEALTLSSNLFQTDISEKFTSIQILGQVLYNEYSLYVVYGGWILLIAMMGAITLTMHTKVFNNHKNLRQVARSESSIKLFK